MAYPQHGEGDMALRDGSTVQGAAGPGRGCADRAVLLRAPAAGIDRAGLGTILLGHPAMPSPTTRPGPWVGPPTTGVGTPPAGVGPARPGGSGSGTGDGGDGSITATASVRDAGRLG